MKQLRIFILALITLTGCQSDFTENNPLLLDTSTFEIETPSKGAVQQANQIIIHYDASVSETQKQNLRNQYGITDFKTCKCADPTLELWILPGMADGAAIIEEVTASANGDSGVEDADFNPKIDLVNTFYQTTFGAPDLHVARNMMVPSNQNVTIAVLDTGVDYNYFGFDQPFLYNNSNDPNMCKEGGMEDYYGWDFVNQDNDPFDDGYGHGTRVSHIIKETLQEHNVNFQILPVKVFDANGEGSYFDILCGFKYAINKEDVDVINMSFGWYYDEYELLQRFIQESEEKVLITASAGNSTVDTDDVPHYPSGYESSNIISTAAVTGSLDDVQLTWFSNFGNNTVDVAAKGQHIPFFIEPNSYILLSGTSYATAYMSAHASIQYDQGISVPEWVQATIQSTTYNQNLQKLKYSSYADY